MATSKNIVDCNENDLLQYLPLDQEATELSPIMYTRNNLADIMSLISENISLYEYYDIIFQKNNLNFSQNVFLLHLNIQSL